MEIVNQRLAALPFSDVEIALWTYFREHQITSAQLIRAPSNYYDLLLEERRDILHAPSIAHLCKTLIIENTAWDEEYKEEPLYFRYLAVVIQYDAKLNSYNLMKYMRDL